MIEEILDREKLNQKSYYIDDKYWFDFFYNVIEYIPYLIFIGLKWSTTKNDKWDSNESARKQIKIFFEKEKVIENVFKSKGWPIYQLFHYFKIETPYKIRKFSTTFFKDKLNLEYINIFFEIVEYSNKIISKHEKSLGVLSNLNKKELNINLSFKKWKKFYKDSYLNKETIKNKLEFILKLF